MSTPLIAFVLLLVSLLIAAVVVSWWPRSKSYEKNQKYQKYQTLTAGGILLLASILWLVSLKLTRGLKSVLSPIYGRILWLVALSVFVGGLFLVSTTFLDKPLGYERVIVAVLAGISCLVLIPSVMISRNTLQNREGALANSQDDERQGSGGGSALQGSMGDEEEQGSDDGSALQGSMGDEEEQGSDDGSALQGSMGDEEEQGSDDGSAPQGLLGDDRRLLPSTALSDQEVEYRRQEV
jgi:hypothetical protein